MALNPTRRHHEEAVITRSRRNPDGTTTEQVDPFTSNHIHPSTSISISHQSRIHPPPTTPTSKVRVQSPHLALSRSLTRIHTYPSTSIHIQAHPSTSILSHFTCSYIHLTSISHSSKPIHIHPHQTTHIRNRPHPSTRTHMHPSTPIHQSTSIRIHPNLHPSTPPPPTLLRNTPRQPNAERGKR
jgi:hypothetical protein